MRTRDDLINSWKRILWIENEMRDQYASCRELVDDNMARLLAAMEDDEKRHINMAERILSILRK